MNFGIQQRADYALLIGDFRKASVNAHLAWFRGRGTKEKAAGR